MLTRNVVAASSVVRRAALNFMMVTATVLLSSGCSWPDSEAKQLIEPPTANNSAQPHLQSLPGGGTVLSWQEQTKDGTTLKASIYNQDQWQPPQVVASGTDWFVNWADFPSITPITDSLWAAHWLRKNGPGNYAYNVAIAFSEDAGANWSEAIIPHQDGTETEHGFVSLFPLGNALGAIWLDGREMVSAEHGANHQHTDHGAGGMTLRSAVIHPDGSLSQQQKIDSLVCDCCQTDVATSAAGPIAVYRNRSAEEVRDIYYSRFMNNQWSEGKAVAVDNWVVNGCPVNGPAVSATNDLVAIAWYTEANRQPRVRLAISRDAGNTFAEILDLDTGQPIGRVDVVTLANQSVFVSWVRRTQDDRGELVLQQVVDGEPLSRPIVVAITDTSRPSGFPQMIQHDESLLFAWTEPRDDGATIKAALIPLAEL